MSNIKAIMNGQEIELRLNDSIVDQSPEAVAKVLMQGMLNSPHRREVNGMYFNRRKIKLQSIEFVNGTIVITAAANKHGAKGFFVRKSDLCELFDMSWI